MPKIDLKLIAVLMIVMICSATSLAYLNHLTTPMIKKNQEAAKERAIKSVLPGAKEYEEITKDGLTLYKGIDDQGQTVGYALENSGLGFAGEIRLMIGLDLDNREVIEFAVLSQSETPGLGARITEDGFQAQFRGKSFADPFQAKQDVDAISGATISSQDVSDIIQSGIKKAEQALDGGA